MAGALGRARAGPGPLPDASNPAPRGRPGQGAIAAPAARRGAARPRLTDCAQRGEGRGPTLARVDGDDAAMRRTGGGVRRCAWPSPRARTRVTIRRALIPGASSDTAGKARDDQWRREDDSAESRMVDGGARVRGWLWKRDRTSPAEADSGEQCGAGSQDPALHGLRDGLRSRVPPGESDRRRLHDSAGPPE